MFLFAGKIIEVGQPPRELNVTVIPWEMFFLYRNHFTNLS